jgi:hypothetical protein
MLALGPTMKPLAPSAAVALLLTFALDADAQSTLDADDPWDGRSASRPLDVIDPWDDSRPPVADPKKEIVPPWPKAKRPKHELNLVDPWTEYPKRRRTIPRRELSVVDPWDDESPTIPTATFPLVAETAAPAPATAPTPPRLDEPVPTARFPLLDE